MITNETKNQEQNSFYAGVGSRIPEYDSTGLKTATREIIEGKLIDGVVISNLSNELNWNSNNQYIGSAITGTYEGQYYYDFYYFYYAYSDNTWIRTQIDYTTFKTNFIDFENGVTISRDIYDNLVFEDPNAGIKTLSELIPDIQLQVYDATVGTGGDYSTVKDAYAAGKRKLKFLSNVTETVTPAIADYLFIDAKSNTGYYTWTCDYAITTLNAVTLMFNNLIISSGYVGSGSSPTIYAGSSILIWNNVTLTMTGSSFYFLHYTTGAATLYANCIWNNVTINRSNTNQSGNPGFLIGGTFINTNFVGGGTSCYAGIRFYQNTSINGLYFTGTYKTTTGTDGPVVFYGANISAIGIFDTSTNKAGIYNSQTTTSLSGCSGLYFNINSNNVIIPKISNSNISIDWNVSTIVGYKIETSTVSIAYGQNAISTINGNVEFIDCDVTITPASTNNAKTINGSLKMIGGTLNYIPDNWTCTDIQLQNVNISAAQNILNNYTILNSCVLSSTLTISTDYNKIQDCKITGLITLSSGAEYNVIAGNTLTGGLVNSSGNNTNYIIGNYGVTNVFPDNIKLPNLTTKTMIGTDSNGNLQGTSLTTDKMWIGVGNVPTEVSTATTALNIGDFTGAYAGLATETNWIDNFTNAVAGSSGDQHFGVGSIGCAYYAYYSQSGWNRFYVDSRITYTTLINALETSGNWTADTYNASIGDFGQTYFNNDYEYRCTDGVYHTWYRNLIVSNTVTSTDITFLPYPQINLGIADNSTFTIPAKADIVSIMVEAETTTSGNISIGSADGLSDIVASTSLPIVIGNKKQLIYQVDPNYPTNSIRTLYVNIDSAATVKILTVIQKLFS